MTKTDLIKTLDTIENTLQSLRVLINDVFLERERLEQDQSENVRIRTQIIDGQRKVLTDLKKVDEEKKILEKKKQALELERAEIEKLIGLKNAKDIDLKAQEKKLDEKMEVARNLDTWTAKLEEKEQDLKTSKTRLEIEKNDFEAFKTATRQKDRENQDFKLSLDRREKELMAREERVSKILGNV